MACTSWFLKAGYKHVYSIVSRTNCSVHRSKVTVSNGKRERKVGGVNTGFIHAVHARKTVHGSKAFDSNMKRERKSVVCTCGSLRQDLYVRNTIKNKL